MQFLEIFNFSNKRGSSPIIMLQNFGSKNEVQNVHKCFGKHICNLVGRESHWVVYLKQDSPVCGLEHYQILFVFVVSS
jgi:hypothetical protein